MFSLTPGNMTFKIRDSAINQIIQTSPQLDQQMKEVAEDIKDMAESEFERQELGTGTGESRQSFVVNKLTGGLGYATGLATWKSKFIEHGAMAGGHTPVLGYRPLLTALDRAVSKAPPDTTGLFGPRVIQV